MEPINEYVVKVASRCNLNCSYCYEYNLGDDSWRRQAKFMDEATCRALAGRIREHSLRHGVSHVFATLHGGEPTLAGPERIDRYCSILRQAAEDAFELQIGLQTNGTLVSDALVAVIRRHRISVSVSIDGDRAANDRHRVDHRGRSSFEATVQGIQKLQAEAPECLDALLAVIDVRNDPIETFDFAASFGIPWMDFLLPHHNWNSPPPRPDGDPVAYGRWYWALFEAWISGRHRSVEIRFLKNIVQQVVGGPNVLESMTLAPCTIVTITSDGDIEAVDCLKSTASGLQQIGLNVHTADLDRALRARMVAIRQSGEQQLCSTCRQCRYKRECAGGYFPHRFSRDREFDNPSVYCRDLMWLIERIERRLSRKTDLHVRV